MQGTVETVKPTFGFIRGSDGVSRFFIPSFLSATGTAFDDLTVGATVEFDAIDDHPKGPRAINVRLAVPVRVDVSDGEE